MVRLYSNIQFSEEEHSSVPEALARRSERHLGTNASLTASLVDFRSVIICDELIAASLVSDDYVAHTFHHAHTINHPEQDYLDLVMASPPPSDSQYISNLSPSPSSHDEVNSLPDSASSDDIDDVDEEEEESDAEKEWKESLQQLELLLTMVLVPYAGKYFGRKCAYWGKSSGHG